MRVFLMFFLYYAFHCRLPLSISSTSSGHSIYHCLSHSTTCISCI